MGGFSSSALMNNLKKQIMDNGLENEISYEYKPFMSMAKDLANGINEFDVIMVCPHQKKEAVKAAQASKVDVPIYVIPPRMYGLVDINELLLDAQDIKRIYAEKHENPFFFPGEENVLRSNRTKAFRKVQPELI